MLKHLPFYGSLLGRILADKTKATNRHVLVYGAVEAHSYGKHGCIASNATIAEETGISERVVSSTLSQLKKSEWVSFDLDEKFRRGEIVPLLTIETPVKKNTPYIKNVPPVNDTTPPTPNMYPPYTGDTTPPTPNILHRSHIEDSIGNNKETVKATATPVASLKATRIKTSKPEKPKALTVEDPSVNQVIELFKVVDLNYTVLYARKTERTAVETLLRLHTALEIGNVLNKAIIYNKLPFVTSYDKIYKPSDLLRNWQKLHDKEAELNLKPVIAKKEAVEKANTRAVW